MEIAEVVLRLKDKEARLSIDEAKEVLRQLNAVFGISPETIIQKEYIPYPVVQPQPPFQPYSPYPLWPWNDPIIYYRSDNTGNYHTSNELFKTTSVQ